MTAMGDIGDATTNPGGNHGDDPGESASDNAGVEEPFRVDVPGYSGGLGTLVVRAQRGEIDLTAIPVREITERYRQLWRRTQVTGEPRADPREVADFLTLASRLLTLKANLLLPDAALNGDAAEEEPDLATEPGRRLAEYRLFKAAAEALLSDAAEDGARSFLGLVAADVVPVERLRIPPEKLAAAFRTVLERLSEPDPLPVGAVTFSVADKTEALRAALRERTTMEFEQLFEGVASRLEAVAIFLALLELLRSGEARVEQLEAFGGISVTRVA